MENSYPLQQAHGAPQPFQGAQLPAQGPTRQPSSGKGPGQSRRRGGTKRKSRWLKTRAGGTRDGAGTAFNHMRRQNAMRSRQHFGAGAVFTPSHKPAIKPHEPPWSAPRTVPRAPDNDNSFLLAQHGRDPQTPTTAGYQWDRNSREHGSSTDLGAQLDFFGTNEGVVRGYSSSGTSSDSDEVARDEEDEDQQDTAAASAADPRAGGRDGGLPDHIRVRLQSQSTYIAQLEEQNLDLQEKYSLLQHDLQEARASARRAAIATAPLEQAADSTT